MGAGRWTGPFSLRNGRAGLEARGHDARSCPRPRLPRRHHCHVVIGRPCMDMVAIDDAAAASRLRQRSGAGASCRSQHRADCRALRRRRQTGADRGRPREGDFRVARSGATDDGDAGRFRLHDSGPLTSGAREAGPFRADRRIVHSPDRGGPGDPAAGPDGPAARFQAATAPTSRIASAPISKDRSRAAWSWICPVRITSSGR